MCTVVVQEPVQVPDELPAGGEGVEQGGEAPVPGQHFTLRAPRVRQGRALNTFLPNIQNFGHFSRHFFTFKLLVTDLYFRRHQSPA
jgi:hypothetical protein